MAAALLGAAWDKCLSRDVQTAIAAIEVMLEPSDAGLALCELADSSTHDATGLLACLVLVCLVS